MVDVNGNPIVIGCKIAYIGIYGSRMTIGKVTSLTPQGVRIKKGPNRPLYDIVRVVDTEVEKVININD